MAAACRLAGLLGAGQGHQGKRGVGIEIERELQEYHAHADAAAFAGKQLSQSVEQLGHALGGRAHQQLRPPAGRDLCKQGARMRMPVGLGLLQVRHEDALRKLHVAGIGSAGRKGQSDPENALIAFRDAAVGRACVGRASGHIGEKCAVIAHEGAGPIGKLRRIEGAERLVALLLRLRDPGSRQGVRQLADRADGDALEVVLGLRVAAGLERSQTQEGMRQAVGGLQLHQVAGQRFDPGPVPLGGFHLERRVEQRRVVRVLLERLCVERRSRRGIVCLGRETARQIAPQPRTQLDRLVRGIADLGGGRRCHDTQEQ